MFVQAEYMRACWPQAKCRDARLMWHILALAAAFVVTVAVRIACMVRPWLQRSSLAHLHEFCAASFESVGYHMQSIYLMHIDVPKIQSAKSYR